MGKLTIHDNFIRSIMSDKKIATAYFQNYLASFLKDTLNLETLEQSTDTYISKDLQKTMSDIVYSCSKKHGKGEVKITILIEHKSFMDRNVPIQIGSYIFSGLLKQVINKQNQLWSFQFCFIMEKISGNTIDCRISLKIWNTNEENFFRILTMFKIT